MTNYNQEQMKWKLGQKLWFGFYILTQWLMFIEYATKPITATNTAYQIATLIYGISGAIGTALILWLITKHSKAALYTILGIAALNCIVNVLSGNIGSALLGMVMPGITYLLTNKNVD